MHRIILVLAAVTCAAWLQQGCSSNGAAAPAEIRPRPGGTEAELIIRTGTSFGMCDGYCLRELTLADGAVTFIEKTWDGSRPDLIHDSQLSQEEWQRLQTLAKPELLGQIPILGCPDCADGGAEWVEITSDAGQNKVTFEFGADIDGLRDLLPILRELRERYDAIHPDH